ncbi:uncharacterized protein LOC143614379 [Bidens hawaiensis]|uniref:uncharacterized protein LOC143614379 n=1 Tax=Bidens hawaiensis TaxID=980011 RepID=UPI00404BA3BC
MVEVEEEKVVDEEIEMEAPCKLQVKTPFIEPQVEKKLVEFQPPPDINIAHVPYPARLKNQKYTREYGHFLDMFRQLKINLPFVEALQHMPKYTKFLKDLLKRKYWLGEVSSIPLSGDCSVVVLNRVPEKLSDPGVFTVPCTFGSDMMSQALADLGASINLMPYSLYEKLDWVPIILGRPFLRTAKALVDVYEGRITLRVGDENVTYDVAKSMKHPSDDNDFSGPCHSVYFLNSFILGLDTCLDYISGADLVRMDEEKELTEIMEDSEEEVVDDVYWLAEIMEVSEVICEKEVEKPAPLEIKVLPSHLDYAYLEEGSNLPVIVSSKLTDEEKSKLIEVLKMNKGSIA